VTGPASDAESGAGLERLTVCLIEGNVEALDIWRGQAEYFARILPSTRLRQIESAMNGFDFETALSLLQMAHDTEDRGD